MDRVSQDGRTKPLCVLFDPQSFETGPSAPSQDGNLIVGPRCNWISMSSS